MKIDTKKMTILAMLSAAAYLVMVLVRIPVVSAGPLVLKYEPKDVIMAIGGFIYGPLAAVVMAIVVSFIEMITVSTTGWIGFVMNLISSCAFICSAALIYKKKRNIKSAVIGLGIGCILTVLVMLLWNYFLTPIFMGVPREAVAKLLVPVFLPFNLIKGGINAAIVMLIYKPIVSGLRKSHLLPDSEGSGSKGKVNIGVVLLSVFVLATCTIFILILQGII